MTKGQYVRTPEYRERQRVAMTGLVMPHKTKHGMDGTPTHRAWVSMLQRCMNPRNKNYPNYGGRGITVCAQWKDFRAFLGDMGERPSPELSLDRIDNDGNYEPGNCRWATRSEQQRNKRRLTHCSKGHLFTAESVYTNPRTGHRLCRICRDAYRRKYRSGAPS